MAVTASSAFPGFFPPMVLTGADVGANEGEFGRQAYTDGGVYDNLGVRMFRYLALASGQNQRSWDGVIVSAPGRDCDFVSRYFAPHAGIPEDPVTGSAHCTLVPYWAKRLGRNRLHARQISKRIGEFDCELVGDRVKIAGRAVCNMRGRIFVDG